MSTHRHNPPAGRLRRRRFAVVLALGLGGVAFLGTGIASGQLPVAIALSGQPFTGSVSALDASGVTAYPRAVATNAGDVPSVAVKIDDARLSDLCLSTVARGLPLIGDVTFVARVPGGAATAESMVIDVASVEGSLTVADVRLGLAADALGEVTGSRTAAAGVGSTAAGATRFDLVALTAEEASIEGLTVTAVRGDTSC